MTSLDNATDDCAVLRTNLLLDSCTKKNFYELCFQLH